MFLFVWARQVSGRIKTWYLMSVTGRILDTPSYGWADTNGRLLVPSSRQLFREALSRMNIFRSRRNWISFLSLLIIISLFPFLYFFLFRYFSWEGLLLFLLYSMFVMSIHATVWLHRYCTHRAFSFRHPFWRILFRNLVIRTVPEEIYVISHQVHHARSDQPGDPYNARGGFWYCMLAEFNHQRIAPGLGEQDYGILVKMMSRSGVALNSYRAYLQWGTLSLPLAVIGNLLLNWVAWYLIFWWLGGHGIACAMFSAAISWFIMVRAFNFTGHGKGRALHRHGIDFDQRNLSLNQLRPGILAGEWHNNHHLFPASARTGFLPYQADLPWLLILGMYKLGIVSHYQDAKQAFQQRYSRGKKSE